MSARTVKIRHDDETRSKIQAAAIINRFHAHVMGEVDMLPTQIQAGRTLLAKVLPDLGAVQIAGDENRPIEHVIRWKSSSTSSTTSQDDNSSTSTTGESDSPASSPTDEPEKP